MARTGHAVALGKQNGFGICPLMGQGLLQHRHHGFAPLRHVGRPTGRIHHRTAQQIWIKHRDLAFGGRIVAGKNLLGEVHRVTGSVAGEG